MPRVWPLPNHVSEQTGSNPKRGSGATRRAVRGGTHNDRSVNDDQEEETEPTNETTYEPPTEEPLLVIRSMKAQKVIENDDQRDQLFHTKGFVRGKCCSIIVDGGSCTNVASQEMVTKLGLATTKHPRPYSLHWLDDGNKVKVTRQTKVALTLGPYQDEILCDVIPMDACHVLLGRPWQFDRDVTHKGRTNEYELQNGGKKITLKPMSSTAIRSMANSKVRNPSLTIRIVLDPVEIKRKKEEELARVEQPKKPVEEEHSAEHKQPTRREIQKARELKPRGGCGKRNYPLIIRLDQGIVKRKFKAERKTLPKELRSIPQKGGGDDTSPESLDTKSTDSTARKTSHESEEGEYESNESRKLVTKNYGKKGDLLDGGWKDTRKDDFETRLRCGWSVARSGILGGWDFGFARAEMMNQAYWANHGLYPFGFNPNPDWNGYGSGFKESATKHEKPKEWKWSMDKAA